jgi:hypothetical protein
MGIPCDASAHEEPPGDRARPGHDHGGDECAHPRCEVRQKPGEGDALTAYAHIEGYLDGNMRGNVVRRLWRLMRYFKDTSVRAEIDAGSQRMLAS